MEIFLWPVHLTKANNGDDGKLYKKSAPEFFILRRFNHHSNNVFFCFSNKNLGAVTTNHRRNYNAGVPVAEVCPVRHSQNSR